MSNLSSTSVLVTGGAGFIGSELVRQLAEIGARVLVVDNLINGKRENIAGLPAGQISLEVADIREKKCLRHMLEGIDVVFHLACLGVRHSIHAPRENHDVNATATLDLLTLAREARVRRFVCVSSSEVYGTARSTPISEDHPTFPKTVYGAGKLAGECYARANWETYRFPTVIVRPFNAFGPRCHHEGDSGEVIPKFMLRAIAGRPLIVFGSGTQTRDFSFVADTARGIIAAGTSDAAVGQTINIGSSTEIAINDLAQAVSRHVAAGRVCIKHDAPRPGDVLRLIADTKRARALIGYIPSVTLSEGLARLYEWYMSLDMPPEALLTEEQIHNWEPPERGHVGQRA